MKKDKPVGWKHAFALTGICVITFFLIVFAGFKFFYYAFGKVIGMDIFIIFIIWMLVARQCMLVYLDCFVED